MEQKILEGTVSLSTAAKIQTAGSKLSREKKEELLNDLAGKSAREVDREISKIDPKGPKETTRWLDGETVLLTFPLDREVFRSLQELLSIRTHVNLATTYKVIVSDLVRLGQKHWNLVQRTASSTEPVWKVRRQFGAAIWAAC